MKYLERIGSTFLGSALLIGCAVKPEVKYANDIPEIGDLPRNTPLHVEHNICYPETLSCESRNYFDLDGDR